MPTPEESFNGLDTDGDGRLSQAELTANRFVARMFQDTDTSRGMSRDEYIGQVQRMRENWQRNGGFGGGRGGGGGRGRRGGPEGDDSDRRRDRGNGDGDRSAGERPADNSGNAPSGDKKDSNADPATPNGSQPAGTPPKGPKPRPRVTVDLQEDLVPGDTDHDGQIGLYEWRRFTGHSLKEFQELDRNEDGFVTPAEVAAVRPPPTPAPTTTPATGTAGPPTNPPAAANAPTGGSTPAANPAPAGDSSTTAQPANEQATRDAKNFFRLLDKNRDGQIAGDEWKDTKTQALFMKNGVDLTQPMSAEVFAGHYIRLSAAPSGG